MAANPQWERYASTRYLQAGETLFKEGEGGDSVYIVRSGEVAISKQTPGGERLVLGYRGPGDLIGEIALISDAPRTASMTASKPTELLVLSRADFWGLLRSDEEFRQVVMETLIQHLMTADQSRLVADMWERDLETRFASLRSEHERMAEVMQLRQETLRFIIHDLRNPLQLAMTALAMIEMEPDYNIESDSGRFVKMAQGGLTRMVNLVEALLDVARLESGEATLNVESIDLDALIREAVEQSQPMTFTSRLVLSYAAPAEPLPRVPADSSRIERVLMNLIDNAIRFSPAAGRVTVSTWREGHTVFVAVNDEGPGIPSDQRERVFDRFVQTEAGRRSTGFGLGLSFCRSAVQAHGGEIRAEAGDRGVGTRMVFSLPL
jgi:signal transduction histidine kinase